MLWKLPHSMSREEALSDPHCIHLYTALCVWLLAGQAYQHTSAGTMVNHR